MGPYCKFCDRRCFLLRVLTDGRSMLLATCPEGMKHDRESCGQDHTTAFNPAVTPGEWLQGIMAARAAEESDPREPARLEPCGCLTNTLGAHRGACPEFETVYPSDWWKDPRSLDRLSWRRRGVA